MIGMALALVWILRVRRDDRLARVAVRVAADVPDDAEAVAEVKAAGGRPKAYKRAARTDPR